MKAKLEDKVKELKNLVKELKAGVVKNDTRLDHLQKRSDERSNYQGVQGVQRVH